MTVVSLLTSAELFQCFGDWDPSVGFRVRFNIIVVIHRPDHRPLEEFGQVQFEIKLTYGRESVPKMVHADPNIHAIGPECSLVVVHLHAVIVDTEQCD